MITVEIPAALRPEIGSKYARAQRAEGHIPCVMYGGKENRHFMVTLNNVRSMIYTPDFKTAEIDIDGTKYRAIVKSVQFHPVTEAIEHIDFQELVKGTPVKVELPIHVEGTSPGVRNGGRLIRLLRRLQVKVLPENLVTELVLDISKLKMGDTLRVRDLDLGEGIETVTPGSAPVVNIARPRALVEVVEDEDEEEEGEDGAAEEGGEDGAAEEGGED